MRFRIGYQRCVLAVLVLLAAPVAFSASITKTITPAPAETLLKSGAAVLDTGFLKVSTQVGEYIPAASSESRALATISKGLSIPSKGIVSTLKSGLKLNPSSLLGGVALQALLDGVDWVMTDGVLMKKGTSAVPYEPTENSYYWTNRIDGLKYSEPSSACTKWSSDQQVATYETDTDIDGWCKVVRNVDGRVEWINIHRTGSSCPANYAYSTTAQTCVSTGSGSPAAVTDADYAVLDNFVLGKDGVWQQSLANEVCKGSGNYSTCVANMGATPYISGPSSVSSPTVTTTSVTTNPDGTSLETTTNTKTDFALSYPSAGTSVEITPKTTTTTTTATKDAAGTTTNTATTNNTTTTNSSSASSLESGEFSDPPFANVGPFYTQKYPRGFKGVWDDNKSALLNSSFMTFLNGFVPSFSGTCPTFGMSFAIMAHANFGSFQFSTLCYIFDFIKVIMLVTAMFTCRALIFGG